jgi:hypothetical protein
MDRKRAFARAPPEAKASLQKFRHPEQAELVSAPLKDL